MIQQEQLSHYSHPPPQSEDLIQIFQCHPHHQSFILGSEQPHLCKTSLDPLSIDLQQNQQPLNLSLLEVIMSQRQKEESNGIFPQKFVEEMPEEDQILMNLAPSTNDGSPLLSNRKQSKIDRTAYLEETRAMKIERYLQKKQRRIWDRKIFYDCRKVVADNRERVNGRFVKKSPLVQGNSSNKKTNVALQESLELQVLKQFNLDGGGLEDCYI